MQFEFKKLGIDGLIEIKPRAFGDARGSFMETYNARSFADAGIDSVFLQDNQTSSKRSVLRGLHFQKRFAQGKLVRVLEGEVFDVAVDLRAGSPTFGSWEAVILSARERNQLWIPPGFAHGFLVLSENAVSAYKCTEFYHPEDEGGIRWDDSALAIDWPDTGAAPILSDKDASLPPFTGPSGFFDLAGGWIGGKL